MDGPLDLSQFTLLAAADVARSTVRLRAGIIGASHVLEVLPARGAPLHEVFACCDVAPPADPARQLYSGSLRELPGGFACEASRGFEYSFSSQLADTVSGREGLRELEGRVAAVEAGRGEIGLAYTFPSREPSLPRTPAVRGSGGGGSFDPDVAPRTIVWARLDPGRDDIQVETAHCYPNEQTIVFSQTRIVVHPKARR